MRGSSSGRGSLDVLTPATGAVTGVRTDRGRRRGRGRRQLRRASGRKAVGDWPGVTVPLHSAEHFYVVTDQVDGRRTPTCRSCATPTAGPTSRRRSAAWSSAASSPRPSRGWRPTEIPYPFEFALLDEDWEHFSVLMDEAVHRIPVLAETGIRKFYNGPESFTPDNQFLLGEAPGAARLLRRRRLQLGRASPRRAAPAGRWPSGSSRASRPATWWRSTSAGSRRSTATPAGCGERVVEILGPALRRARGPTASSRPRGRCGARRCTTGSSPRGAVLRQPRWAGSAPTSSPRPGTQPVLDYTWGKPRWLPWSAAEQRATRDGGGGLRPDVVLEVRRRPGATPRRRCSGSAAADVAVPGRQRRLHRRCSTGAAPTRPTSPSPGSADDEFLPGQQLGDDRARPGLDPPARPRRARHRAWST